ncbi:hypothetical protein [Azospirillum argentinense]|uniref:hypothetical protein n=1 Tax=Azospirillum argentinense TaxID=2970906 RepID=UPI0032E0233E
MSEVEDSKTPPGAGQRLVIVDAEAVALLEGLLENARAGRVSGLAVLALGVEDGTSRRIESVHTAAVGSVRRNVHTALGGVRTLEEWMLRNLFDWDAPAAPPHG